MIMDRIMSPCTPGMEMCAERSTGCVLDDRSPVGGVVGDNVGTSGVGCQRELNEVMVGRTLTGGGIMLFCPHVIIIRGEIEKLK